MSSTRKYPWDQIDPILIQLGTAKATDQLIEISERFGVPRMSLYKRRKRLSDAGNLPIKELHKWERWEDDLLERTLVELCLYLERPPTGVASRIYRLAHDQSDLAINQD